MFAIRVGTLDITQPRARPSRARLGVFNAALVSVNKASICEERGLVKIDRICSEQGGIPRLI